MPTEWMTWSAWQRPSRARAHWCPAPRPTRHPATLSASNTRCHEAACHVPWATVASTDMYAPQCNPPHATRLSNDNGPCHPTPGPVVPMEPRSSPCYTKPGASSLRSPASVRDTRHLRLSPDQRSQNHILIRYPSVRSSASLPPGTRAPA